MFVQIFFGVMLLMAEQVGCQSGSRLNVHSHLNISQGGILNEYSRYGAYRRPYRTGALTCNCSNPAVKTSGAIVYTLLKEIRINAAQVGLYRISWEMRSTSGVDSVFSRFYVNNVAIGAEQTQLGNAYIAYTHNYDVNLALNDLLQIWGYVIGATTIQVRFFSILYDWQIEYFGDGTSRNLVTALPLSDVDLLDFTNTVI